MTGLTGLFQRGGSYYIQVVLPLNHPLKAKYKNGKYVASLGRCSFREAVRIGTLRRAAILAGGDFIGFSPQQPQAATQIAPVVPVTTLRSVFLRWEASKTRTSDSINNCQRALCLFEKFTGNKDIAHLTRDQGDGFRAWLQHADRKTTSKTARDRLTWVKSLLKFAYRELELIPRNPWEGISITARTTMKRRPWGHQELVTLLSTPLFEHYALPTDRKAGADAAYWIPLLGMFTGARIGELAQLRVVDVDIDADCPMLGITDEGDQQRVKTAAGIRQIPIHSELIRLGFIDYVRALKLANQIKLWPVLPTREGKPGGYISQWFGEFRRSLGLSSQPDFHSFRHTVRSQLANAAISEQLIDLLLGHEAKGSIGAKVYTHRANETLRQAIESITYPGIDLPKIQPLKVANARVDGPATKK